MCTDIVFVNVENLRELPLFNSSQGTTDFGHHNARVGTIRYMAPEVLSQSINCQDFEALKRQPFQILNPALQCIRWLLLHI